MARSIVFGRSTWEMSNNATSSPATDAGQAAAPKDIDLGGDISLVFGPKGNQVRVKALKPMLMMISPYFRTMFGPTFNEGNKSEHEDIELDEDEPEAVINLFRILHLQYTAPTPMTVANITGLAVVADKYDCVKAIQLGLGALFPQMSMFMPAEDIVKLAVAAHLLDRPQLFRSYTSRLMTAYSDSIPEYTRHQIAQRIPSHAWSKLDKRTGASEPVLTYPSVMMQARREAGWKQIAHTMLTVLSPPCKAERCHRMGEWYSKLGNKLKGLIHGDSSMAVESIASLMAKAKGIVIPDMPNCKTQGYPDHGDWVALTQGKYDALLSEVQEHCNGLCLDCVKQGEASGMKCALSHRKSS